MIVMPLVSRRVWFIGLLFLVGVQLIFGMMQDGHVLASAYEPGSAQDRPYPDASRFGDILDEAQEQDDSVAGLGNGNNSPPPNSAGLRVAHLLLPGQLELMSGPFHPPRLSV